MYAVCIRVVVVVICVIVVDVFRFVGVAVGHCITVINAVSLVAVCVPVVVVCCVAGYAVRSVVVAVVAVIVFFFFVC